MRTLYWLAIPVAAAAIALLAVSFSGTPEESVDAPKSGGGNLRSIHVEVLNGCGTDGIAKRAGGVLRKMGFDVMTMGNAGSYSYPESMVLDRVGKPEYARLVADALGITYSLQQKVADPFRIEEVTVIIGRDYGRLNLGGTTESAAGYRQTAPR